MIQHVSLLSDINSVSLNWERDIRSESKLVLTQNSNLKYVQMLSIACYKAFNECNFLSYIYDN